MILYCGDTHGELKHIQREISKLKPKAVILLGDIEPPMDLNEALTDSDIYFIPGNHDGEKQEHYDRLFKSGAAKNNLHGRVVEIDGLRIAGLGGVFDEKIWMPPSEPLYENLAQWEEVNRYRDPYFEKHRRMLEYGAIFYDDYLALMLQKADVLVVHDAPSCHPYGYEAIDDLAKAMGAKIVFHGDHHDSLDYSADAARMGFRTYGVGYRGITSTDGQIIREGDYDRERMAARMQKKADRESMFSIVPRRFAM